MERNVGGLDRIVRGVLGTWLVVVGLAAHLDGERTRAVIALIAGSGLLVNAIGRFCGGNYLLGIDTTCSADSTQSSSGTEPKRAE